MVIEHLPGEPTNRRLFRLAFATLLPLVSPREMLNPTCLLTIYLYGLPSARRSTHSTSTHKLPVNQSNTEEPYDTVCLPHVHQESEGGPHHGLTHHSSLLHMVHLLQGNTPSHITSSRHTSLACRAVCFTTPSLSACISVLFCTPAHHIAPHLLPSLSVSSFLHATPSTSHCSTPHSFSAYLFFFYTPFHLFRQGSGSSALSTADKPFSSSRCRSSSPRKPPCSQAPDAPGGSRPSTAVKRVGELALPGGLRSLVFIRQGLVGVQHLAAKLRGSVTA